MSGVHIADIASVAGVSPATVSLVLNNKPGVSPDTRSRILELARSLEYDLERSNNLAHGKAATIRFLKVARHGHTVNDDHAIFIANYINGLSLEARSLKLTLEIMTINGGPAEALVSATEDPGIAGAIVLATEMTSKEIRLFKRVNTPLVFIDNYDETEGFNFVDMNNKESVLIAISHFMEHGHREIGMATSDVATPNFQMRTAAFNEALQRFSLPSRGDFIFHVDSTYAGALRDMSGILTSGAKLPTALFCVNDIVAFGCIRALKDAGIRVPEDISIIGFDNLPASAMVDPPLTTIEVSKVEIGRLAMRTLYNDITLDLHQHPVKQLVSGELVERLSVKALEAISAETKTN
jgi:LacI family transcriptional regulator